jgi:hypothetical protein
VLPSGDDDEFGAALARARELRALRDQLVAQVRAGTLTLPGLFDLDRADDRVGTIKVVVLLEAVPAVGKVAARKALAGAGLDENVRIGRLSTSRREQLVAALS